MLMSHEIRSQLAFDPSNQTAYRLRARVDNKVGRFAIQRISSITQFDQAGERVFSL
jgi:hypothetical protein